MEGQKDSEPGRSATARAVALAHLLHQECKNLLELYKERESFLSHHVPEGERLLIYDSCSDTPSSEQRVGHAHSALSRCLEMLECLIAREVEELGEEFEGEYETVRNTVKNRLGHLLHSTGALLENGENVCTPLPEFQCVQWGPSVLTLTGKSDGFELVWGHLDDPQEENRGMDEVEGTGGFAAKLWTYRVLLELIHWSDTAAHALRLLHSEQENEQEL